MLKFILVALKGKKYSSSENIRGNYSHGTVDSSHYWKP
jgi:hypothetical protein